MSEGTVSEVFFAYGHVNVQATHKSTLEFTKEAHLSRTGDCIIAVTSTKALASLSDEFKAALRKPDAKITITIEANGVTERINAKGSPHLTLTHASDMVIRKSSHVDSRTLAVGADKAARDLSRMLVVKLQNPRQKAKITLTVTF